MAALEAAVLHGIEVHVSVGSGLDHDDALVDGGADGGPAGGVVLDWAVSGVDPRLVKGVLQLDQHDVTRLHALDQFGDGCFVAEIDPCAQGKGVGVRGWG